jgi:hypothetical protein
MEVPGCFPDGNKRAGSRGEVAQRRASGLCMFNARTELRPSQGEQCRAPDFPLITIAFEAVLAEITSPKR